MGCYNHMGFYSRLPITYKDNIVIIIGFHYNESKSSNSDIYATDDFTPLFLPIKGDYNDYGGIENYKSPISDSIEKAIQMPLCNFLESIDRDCAFMSLNDIAKDKESNDNSYTLELYKNYEKGLKNIVENINISYFDKNEISLSYTMERYDVYKHISQMFENEEKIKALNKLIEIKKEIPYKSFLFKEPISYMSAIELRLDNILNEIYDKIKDDKIDNDSIEALSIANKQQEKYNLFYKEIPNLISQLSVSYSDDICKGYEFADIDYDRDYDSIKEFVFFNLGLHLLNGTYCQSVTASQSINDFAKEFKSLNELYGTIIDNLI